MKILELDILHCGDCPFCQLVYNFLNLDRSKYYCYHPQNMTPIDTKKNIEENGWSLLENCPLKDKEGSSDRYGDSVKYQVRFYSYQYNSGAGDNHTVCCKKTFDNMKKAERYSRKIKRILEHREDIKHYSSSNKRVDKLEEIILDEFLSYSGFIESYDGIYEVIE